MTDIWQATPDYPVARQGIRTVPLRGGRWRVTRERGEVLGYVDRIDTVAGIRYRSARFRAQSGRMLSLGEFGSADDALDVVRT